VCDFNLSRMVSDNNTLINSGNPNSPGWQSPEMLAGGATGAAGHSAAPAALPGRMPWTGRHGLHYRSSGSRGSSGSSSSSSALQAHSSAATRTRS
jgi:hypothetical protein